jgi:hypothetical protein
VLHYEMLDDIAARFTDVHLWGIAITQYFNSNY